MPPPPAVAAALQRVLDDLPSMSQEFFESTYQDAVHKVDDYPGGGKIEFVKSGLSRSNPINIGYEITLGTIYTNTYTIWLYNPQDDPAVNRRAIVWGCRGLIETPHNSKFMIGVDARDFIEA
ncbi:hypothetical protein BV20DRAFT_975228 [Pilatotrama ljubarskyi]|nr:hypothetical protein BV20DRAFT_975228 [Pilatotrama ljubarskyi]